MFKPEETAAIADHLSRSAATLARAAENHILAHGIACTNIVCVSEALRSIQKASEWIQTAEKFHREWLAPHAAALAEAAATVPANSQFETAGDATKAAAI